MRPLSYAIVLVAATGVGVAFRHGLSGTSEASRSLRTAGRLDGPAAVDRPAGKREGPGEGAPLATASPASGAAPGAGGDLVFARIAAECGHHLLEKSRREPDNPRLLRQAAGHLRACLSHETPASSGEPLFVNARRAVEEIERLLKRHEQPQAREKAPAAPAPAKPEAAPPAAKEESAGEPIMVGPDGVSFRREKGSD